MKNFEAKEAVMQLEGPGAEAYLQDREPPEHVRHCDLSSGPTDIPLEEWETVTVIGPALIGGTDEEQIVGVTQGETFRLVEGEIAEMRVTADNVHETRIQLQR